MSGRPRAGVRPLGRSVGGRHISVGLYFLQLCGPNINDLTTLDQRTSQGTLQKISSEPTLYRDFAQEQGSRGHGRLLTQARLLESMSFSDYS